MDADAKALRLFRITRWVELRQPVLDLDRALNSIDGTRKLGQDAIAGRVGNPATVLLDEPIHDLSMSGQAAKGADFILAHEMGVASHVSGKDRRQPPL
jgi:hypothetical protein